MFDPENIAAMEVEGSMSTEFVVVPPATYTASIKDLTGRQHTRDDGSIQPILDITWLIDDPDLEDITGRPENTIKQSLFLDLTEGGQLDLSKGKNTALGRLREALNQNGPQVWNPSMLMGQVASIIVEYGKDPRYTNVTKVAALS